MEDRQEVYKFRNERDWLNSRMSWFLTKGVDQKKCIALDAVGRICESGREFIRATKENTYPVTVYIRK